MRGQIFTLRKELAEEQRKRVAERENADKELLAALTNANAYADELIRIFKLEHDDHAMRAMLNKLISEYKKSHGYGTDN